MYNVKYIHPCTPQVDRHEDMLRSCLRAVDALAQLPGITACAPFVALMRRVVMASPIKVGRAASALMRACVQLLLLMSASRSGRWWG